MGLAQSFLEELPQTEALQERLKERMPSDLEGLQGLGVRDEGTPFSPS